MSGHAVVTWVTGGESDPLAILDAGNFVKVAEANYALPHAKEYARLIASAPELLEALESLLLGVLDIRGIDIEGYCLSEVGQARAAIVRATGGSDGR